MHMQITQLRFVAHTAEVLLANRQNSSNGTGGSDAAALEKLRLEMIESARQSSQESVDLNDMFAEKVEKLKTRQAIAADASALELKTALEKAHAADKARHQAVQLLEQVCVYQWLPSLQPLVIQTRSPF